MKYIFLRNEGSSQLTIFFTGWGMDDKPFSSISLTHDVLMVYDYTVIDAIPLHLIEEYKDIRIVAWSFGVWVASVYLSRYIGILPVSETFALNGTPFPIDDEKGISHAIFNGTLDNLNDRTLYKFRKRMCGKQYESFIEQAPQRTTENLKQELSALHQSVISIPSTKEWFREVCRIWYRAYICQDDKIFTALNQSTCWNLCEVPIVKCQGEHYDADLIAALLRGEHIAESNLMEQIHG